MKARPSRHLTDRDLRGLSTGELLDLIEQDLREMDKLVRERRRKPPPPPPPAPKPPARGRKASAGPQLFGSNPDDPEQVPLHSVRCCDNHLGDFMPGARVRCPFCEEWHRAGDFPLVQ